MQAAQQGNAVCRNAFYTEEVQCVVAYDTSAMAFSDLICAVQSRKTADNSAQELPSYGTGLFSTVSHT